MECLVCQQKIKPGEQVFWGSQMICDGPGYADFNYSLASNDSMVVVHVSCIESLVPVAKTSNTATPEPVEEESLVKRSAALALFDL